MTETLDKIRERKGYYIHYYRVMVSALRAMLFLILLLIFGIFFVRANYTEPLSYATSSDGTLLPVKTSTQPPYPLQK
jgi:hypothetical protein